MFWYVKTRIKLLLGRGVFNSYSQFGEDMVVKSLLRYITNGTYIDIGCYDPVLYSNTYYFYIKGWSGVTADPNPSLAARYKMLRPRDIFMCSGVGTGERSYKQQADGAYNKFTEGDGMKLTPLSEIFKKFPHVDFLSVDVEGMEQNVLESHDWKVLPTVIAVEHESFDPHEPHKSPVYNLLYARGYRLRGLCNLTLIWKLTT